MKLLLTIASLFFINLSLFSQDLFKNSLSLDALFGYTVSKSNFNDKVFDQQGNYFPNPDLHNEYYMHIGLKLASKFFLGGNDIYKSGIAVDWIEFNMNLIQGIFCDFACGGSDQGHGIPDETNLSIQNRNMSGHPGFPVRCV